MALARPTPTPDDGDIVGPLVHSHPSTPVVTVALATKPATHLRSGDRRRLARQISGAERRVSRIVPPSEARTRLIRRLWNLADLASRAPAREGIALVASSDEGRHLTLHHSVTDRIIVGPPPAYDDIVEATWGIGRLAVLRLTERGSRLICSDGAALWEPRPPWDPLGLQAHTGLERAEQLIRTVLPGRTPLVVAGDHRLVTAFGETNTAHDVAGVLPGDHSGTSATTLVALAQRAMRRALDGSQRAAMTSLALALNCDSAVRGLEEVRRASPIGPHDVLLVEVGALPLLRAGGLRPTTERVHEAGGSVVELPDGFLAQHDRAALVPGHRTTPPSADSDPIDGSHSRNRALHLVEELH